MSHREVLNFLHLSGAPGRVALGRAPPGGGCCGLPAAVLGRERRVEESFHPLPPPAHNTETKHMRLLAALLGVSSVKANAAFPSESHIILYSRDVQNAGIPIPRDLIPISRDWSFPGNKHFLP